MRILSSYSALLAKAIGSSGDLASTATHCATAIAPRLRADCVPAQTVLNVAFAVARDVTPFALIL